MITKLFRGRIRSLVSRNVIHTVTAVGIPCISSDITEIKLSHVAGIFGLGEEEIRRGNGPVDLLVGIDHPKLHTGETALLQDSPPLAGSYLEPHPENMNK